MKLRILDADAVRSSCSMAEAIDAVAEGFRALSQGRATVPLRAALPLRAPDATVLVMPASLEGSASVSVKVVSIVPANVARGLPLVQAAVLVVDADTGAPRALLDGTSLTALRTGAAGGLAARLLAREDARVVALYGAGAQARTQLQALLAVRRVEEVRVVAAHRERAAAFARELARGGVPARGWGPDAAGGADVVVCATTSAVPVFDPALLGDGVHITAVGSFRADMCEIAPEALRGATVVVDQREAALAEAGEIVAAVREGILRPDALIEIGEPAARRASATERTVFKSVGNAVQDLVVAARILANAEASGLGALVDL